MEQVRRGNRQAAPFSKGAGKRRKKKPGRKTGKGTFTRRSEPEPGPTDKVEEIAVPLDDRQCPQCGEKMEVSTEVATTIDAPVEPARIIKRFEVEVGRR